MKIHYATGNKGKFEEAAHILKREAISGKGWEIVHAPLHLEELQGTNREIARHKVLEAYRLLEAPCIVDDVSLFCPELGGLPGPYIRHFLQAIGDVGLAKLISHYEDRSCIVSCLIAFQQQETGEPLYFEGIVHGHIVPPRGKRKPHPQSWNAIVEPEGSTHTYAEMTLDEMSRSSPRYKALSLFRDYLVSHAVNP